MTRGAESAERADVRGPRHDEIAALVSLALDLRDQGRADWLETACAQRPELTADVRRAVERTAVLPALIGRAGAFDPLCGHRLGGRFEVLERIGAGAMGAVYRAQDLELGREVACKVVHFGLMPPEQALVRFEREAQAMAAVQHPAVITIHDRGRTGDDQVYIVMERIDGPSLSSFVDAARTHAEVTSDDDASWIESELGIALRGDKSYVRTVVRWIAELASGLEAVHRAGVLHRDIKPSNVLVRSDGRPVLLDFGVALLEDQSTATRSPTSIGTPAYMPPETLQRDMQRTPTSDVYALTATLYHLLTLRAPYEGTPTQILSQLASADPVPAVHARPGLPRDLQAILDKGMHRKPGRRYATAASLEADLRAFLEFRPVAARPVSAPERVARRLARSRAARGAVGAVALLAIAVGARELHARHVEALRVEHAAIARHFPPNFTVVGVNNREVRDDADRAALSKLLDAAADVAVEPLPTRMLRASFREDHGDAAGAASDMHAVASFVDTPFARELASRYGSARSDVRGIGALDLDGLPAATSALDRYVLGYHRLRQEKTAEALALLGDPAVREIPHAEELFLAFTPFDGLQGADRYRLALERYADLVRLESRIGMRTAATAHVAGRVLAVQGRFADAAAACDDGIALAPRSHVLRLNAGYCAFSQGRLETAREQLLVARELRPHYAHVVEDLFWVEIAARRFDAAAELVRAAGPELVPASATWTDYWSGVAAAYAALDARDSGDAAGLARNLAAARACFERVPKRVADDDGNVTDTAYRIVLALEQKDEDALVLVFLDLLAESSTSWWRQKLLLDHMPATLGPDATQALRGVIEALGLQFTLANPK